MTQQALQTLERQKELYVRALRNTTRELESKIEELGLLRQLGELFERSARIENVAVRALQMFLNASGAEQTSILLYGEATGELALLAAAGRRDPSTAYYGPQGYARRMFARGEGIAGAALDVRDAIFLDDINTDSRFLPRSGGVGIGSLACLPLYVHEQPVGVVNLSHPQPGGLDASRLPLWNILASYLAIALAHADGIEQLRRANRQLEERVRARTRSLEKVNRELRQAKAEIAQQNDALQIRVDERTRELSGALEELQVQHDQLEEANRVKDEFLNNINHELKTPLNAIIGYAGLLLRETEEALSADQRADLGLVEANGKHLQLILENIFSLKDIENGTIELDRRSADLNELIASAVASVRPRAAEREIELTFEPLDIPPVLIDTTLVRRVLFNLLDNAIKFGNHGSVLVRSRTGNRHPDAPQTDVPASEGGVPCAIVEVQDQGKGIQPGDVDRIFQKFQQGEAPTRKSEGGSGVGLTIAKNLVELHGGRIWVTSRPGSGSTFGFCLPLEG